MTRAAAALIVMREFKAAAFLQLAARERMTHSLMVPAMYNLCLLDPAFEQATMRPGASAAMAEPRWRPRPSRASPRSCRTST
jgi:hypothetical protein